MTFDEYQRLALSTAYPEHLDTLMGKSIWALGIAGEAGEVADKIKKILVYENGKITDKDKAELAKELGDVLWYIAILSHTLDLSFDKIATDNVKKIKSRQKRDVISGSGDNR